MTHSFDSPCPLALWQNSTSRQRANRGEFPSPQAKMWERRANVSFESTPHFPKKTSPLFHLWNFSSSFSVAKMRTKPLTQKPLGYRADTSCSRKLACKICWCSKIRHSHGGKLWCILNQWFSKVFFWGPLYILEIIVSLWVFFLCEQKLLIIKLQSENVDDWAAQTHNLLEFWCYHDT